MENTNLSDREQQILQYIKSAVSVRIDPADLKPESAFLEMFANPHIDVLRPLMEHLDIVTLSQSPENARFLTDEKMDEVGRRYNRTRKYGEKSQGYVLFEFEDIPPEGYIKIPKGFHVKQTDRNLLFKTLETVMYDEITISQHYNPATFTYIIPVKTEAEAPGAEYNVNEGAINAVAGASIKYLINVTNESKFIGGSDTETNVEFAQRIMDSLGSPNLGVVSGYNNLLQSYDEIEDFIVAGYRHPLMKRDIIGDINDTNVTYHENIKARHWGTKVDIYVKGKKLVDFTETYPLDIDEAGKFFVVLQQVPVHDVVHVSMSPTNIEFNSPDIDFSQLTIPEFYLEKEENIETIGTLDEVSKLYVEHRMLRRGMLIDVTYSQNAIPSEIESQLYETDDENRPPCADVKVKLARPLHVAINMSVGLEGDMPLQYSDILHAKTRLEFAFNQTMMGDDIQLSDLVDHVYDNYELDTFSNIDYIDLPFQAMVFERSNMFVYECLNDAQQELFLETVKRCPNAYQSLFTHFKENITFPSFMNALHVAGKRPDDFKDESIGITNRFRELQEANDVYRKIDAVKMLSPYALKGEEPMYFTLSKLNIEAVDDTLEKWEERYLTLLASSTSEEGEQSVKKLLLFCLLIVVIISSPVEYREDKIQKLLHEMV